MTGKYEDVNQNEVKFLGKITLKAEKKGFKMELSMINVNREDIKPLLGMDWLREFYWTIHSNNESRTNETDQSEKNKITTNFDK